MSRTLKHPLADKQPLPSRQSGAAALIILLMLVLLAASVLMERLNSAASIPTIRSAETAVSLAEAKATLIAWAVTHPETPGMLPYPDGNLDPEGYDGLADCAVAGPAPALLLGRLPSGGEVGAFSACAGLPGFTSWPMDARVMDAEGEPLWYAVSANLLRTSGVPINSGMLDNPTPAFPWITVRDRNGAIIPNQVAAVIIAPGTPLSAVPRVAAGPIDQSGRAAVAAPAAEQFLDGIDVGGTVFSNADADGCRDDDVGCVVASGEDFIMAPDSRLTANDADNFNDQLIYITVEELIRATEKRVLGEVAVMLEDYRGTYGRYPWLSPFRPPPRTATSVSAPVGGEKILIDLEAAFLTEGFDNDERIRNPDIGPPLWPPGWISSIDSETQLTIEEAAPIASGDPYVILLHGHEDVGLDDTRLINSDGGDFLSASVRPGDQIRNGSKNVDGVVVSVVDDDELVIAAFDSFEIGNTYDVAPAAFDAVIGTREGHIPFIDTAAGETYTFAAGFTVNPWTNGTIAVGPWVDVLLTIDPALTWHNNSDTGVETAILAALTRPNDALPLVVLPENGVCTWTGDERRVKCRGFVEQDIDLRNTNTSSNGPYYPYIPYTGTLYSPGNKASLIGIHENPGGHWDNGWLPTGEDIGSESWITIVKRRFTFDIDYEGDSTTVPIDDEGKSTPLPVYGVKARNVIGALSSGHLPGSDHMKITVEDSVQFPDLVWRVIASASLDLTVPGGPGVNTVDTSIYYDLRDDDELPAWFSVNDWSTYIYAKISADHVLGGDGDCFATGNCVSLQVEPSTGPPAVVVHPKVRAALVAAGPALAGQDRERGTCPAGPPDDLICALFESANNTAGNDTAERNIPTAGFNDQVRVVPPTPP